MNQTVSITENFDGKTIDHLKTLPASVRFITEDGHGVQDNATMARAFAICTQRDITVMSHAEDMEISPWDYRLAEDIETVRNCWLSEYYQTRLHMCHVSTRGAIEAIQMAKLRGAPVTCEVTPHHLWFTNDTCDYRVNPPIRTADDVQMCIRDRTLAEHIRARGGRAEAAADIPCLLYTSRLNIVFVVVWKFKFKLIGDSLSHITFTVYCVDKSFRIGLEQISCCIEKHLNHLPI